MPPKSLKKLIIIKKSEERRGREVSDRTERAIPPPGFPDPHGGGEEA